MITSNYSRKRIFPVMGILAVVASLLSFSSIKPTSPPADEKPDESRFTPVVVTEDLDEPMVFEVLKDGTAFIIERKGGFKKYDPVTNTTSVIATIPVNTKYTSAEGQVREAEEGLMGLSLDPNFEQNHWLYLYYAHPTEKKHVLSRWEFKDDAIKSEKVMLEVPTQREVCCHTGGGMTWDKAGNLYLTVGNNTGNGQFGQTDERPGRSSWDDQRGSSNTNDLRGKILRIHPEPNGSYTIPAGNLFPKGTPKTRPEIYTMGHRNPWRIFVDSKTGYIYWGEVGPDATDDTPDGPRGYDELNQAKKPGFYGWPYFIADNVGYPFYDYVAKKGGDKKDPTKPLNNSVNNTGLTELPPAQPAFIYYPYGVSEKFPLVGSGSRSATGGPIYHRSDFKNAKRPWPAYYEGKWIATDFSRGWIMAITMDENSNYKSMERILPNYRPVEPIDMKFGPNGDLYVLEYGSNWFRKSDNSALVRIEYNGGNRKPLVHASSSKTGGTVPFQATLSSQGTKDFDGDALKYQWKVTTAGGAPKLFTTANPAVTFDKAGVYTATLTVTDAKGASNSQSIKIIAGNEPPAVTVDLAGNKTFYFTDQPLAYDVTVSDKEDGSLANGKITPAQVAMSIDYLSEGFDYAEIIQGQRSVDASTQFAVAKVLMSKSDCNVCHQLKTKSVGPMFTEIATKYQGDAKAPNYLINKIRNGGSGVWGEVNMPAHPAMSVNDASTIVNYILNSTTKTLSTLPVKGTYTVKLPEGDKGKGSVLIRAAYTDRGVKTIPAQTAENSIVLRSADVSASSAEVIKGAEIKARGMGSGSNVIPFANSYIGFKKLDLSGIQELELAAAAQKRDGSVGGTIEVRLDSPTGDLIGEVKVERAPEQDIAKVMAQLESQKADSTKAKPDGTAPKPAPANPNPFYRPPVKASIKMVNGIHDVYFVFKNEAARPIEPLMTLTSIKFLNEKNEKN
ncbi:PQQ-dependent sugar dehydrogenase [Xanthocytophaga flava]|uniref:PQQ-dependent sugar dehydrogenase n=1 Tax=Xanthocytophaga flava TaxID=3048013 RepID=UPI0028D0BA5A|nr:PQQ-dependent sugar dehydrogenase [Xanthocytophaga flavus]MDJ1468694.1 PQQ-dependent sugar dehydrogenase [Xanthocytophaga flavus]